MNKNNKILIKGGRLIDPANKLDDIGDILIGAGKIIQVGKDIKVNSSLVIDASGRIIVPGLVDMHVHLREPGRKDKETVASGTKAAAKGGVTSVLAMPNTQPAIDCPENVRLLKESIKNSAAVRVFICAAVTKGRKGEELTDIAKLKKEGVVAISDDGSSVDCDKLMLKALSKAREEKVLVICHSEDKGLSKNGVVNLGLTSTRMGLRGISRESEYGRVKRDIFLAQKSKARLHIAHVSCRESVELIFQAKKKGLKITAETAPHYFALTEDSVLGYDTNMKMNPPLRGKEDVAAIKQGLADGVIDIIASDHAPHTKNEKDIEFEQAEFGVIGLETELAVSARELVHKGILSWPQLVEKMSLNPAKILGINKGTLSLGQDADIVIFSADKKWKVSEDNLVSKSKNSAFLGLDLPVVVEYTVCRGEVVYSDEVYRH
ncbi:MAG: dihydroorotase [Candidatus Omnitrophica bacterium]|nr:dihydroorotase [Candidatus Omnitrophota bacterium]